MRAFRLAPEKYARDLSGTGARLAGGRWNPKGQALLYTSTTAALAALEYLVHLDWDLAGDLLLVEIEVPAPLVQDLRTSLGIRPTATLPLPEEWNLSPPPPALAALGEKWIVSQSSAGLLVPSVHFPNGPDENLLLNPVHPRFAEVKTVAARRFEFDRRLREP